MQRVSEPVQEELPFMEEIREERKRAAEVLYDAFRKQIPKLLGPSSPPVGYQEIIPGICSACGGFLETHWPGCPIGDPDPTLLQEGLTHDRTDSPVMEVNLKALNCHLVRITHGPGTVEFPNGHRLLFDEHGSAIEIDETDRLERSFPNPEGKILTIDVSRIPYQAIKIYKDVHCGHVQLPNGDMITFGGAGEYALIDAQKRLLYKTGKAYVFRNYNDETRVDPYVLTSDSLEEFIREAGKCGVTQDKLLKIPIEVFINWLILRAASRDGDQNVKDIPKLEEDLEKHSMIV